MQQHKLQTEKRCNTIYPRNMVCFMYTIVNTLHKGENKDDDNNTNNNNNNNNNNNKHF